MPDAKTAVLMRPWLMGQAAGAIDDIKPAKGTSTLYFPLLPFSLDLISYHRRDGHHCYRDYSPKQRQDSATR